MVAIRCLAAMLAVLAVVLAPPGARAACEMNRVALLPITLWQQKLYVPVSINGTEEHLFIDTGAAVTTLAESTARALELPRDFNHTADAIGVGGKESHLYLADVDRLALGGITVAPRPYPVAAFGERMADGSPVGGLIGADIVSRFDVEIDIAGRRLGLWKVAGCSAVKPDWQQDYTAVPMQVMASRHVTVPVRVDDTQLDLLLDTGSPNLVLSTGAAARAGATPDVLEESRHLQGRGVNDRAFSAWLHVFKRVQIGGQVFGDVRAVVVSNGRLDSDEGLLGLSTLMRGPIWLSYSTGMFFVQNGGG